MMPCDDIVGDTSAKQPRALNTCRGCGCGRLLFESLAAALRPSVAGVPGARCLWRGAPEAILARAVWKVT